MVTHLPGKSKLQCQHKYLSVLHSNTSDSERYHEWSTTEKELLLECANIYGRDWERISRKVFTWMTPLKLKNKHYAMTKLGEKVSSQMTSVATPKDSFEVVKESVTEMDVIAQIKMILESQ